MQLFRYGTRQRTAGGPSPAGRRQLGSGSAGASTDHGVEADHREVRVDVTRRRRRMAWVPAPEAVVSYLGVCDGLSPLRRASLVTAGPRHRVAPPGQVSNVPG